MPKKLTTNYRPEMLRSVVERLDRLSGRLKAVLAWMEDEQHTSLPVTNHSSMVQGLEFAEAFGQAAERAVDNCRLDEYQQEEQDAGGRMKDGG